MKVLAYFGLTMLSILIQFCVMDFIHPFEEQLDLSATNKKNIKYDILKNISYKPHALYYQTKQDNPQGRIIRSTKIYSNSTLPETILSTSTEMTSTIVDFYDENVSSTDSGTTEALATTTDPDNITEITLFEKPNSTNPILSLNPKKNVTYEIDRKCSCNLMFRVCDVNCCCDEDCSEKDKLIFNCVKENTKPAISQLCFSYNPFKFDLDIVKQDDFIDNLFCIAKTNLPEHRDIHDIKVDINTVNKVYKWRDKKSIIPLYKFSKQFYKPGDPIWIYESGSLSHLSLPTKTVNYFCTERKPLRFLQEDKINCNVKLSDLEMLEVYRMFQESQLVSALADTINATILNCSTMHCTNWSVIVCDTNQCIDYNKNLHEPICSSTDCRNIAWKVQYVFYYHENKITNATIKLFVHLISSPYQNEDMGYISQEISVKFILTNESIENIITLSGTPGYITGLPVIVSYARSNYTDSFFNVTHHNKNLPLLKNVNGVCASSNTTKDFVLFGVNKRKRCRFTYTSSLEKETNPCEKIQNGINELLGIIHNVTISPLGNPFGIKDEHWKTFETGSLKTSAPAYGQTSGNKLQCYNMITRIAYIFIYADVSENHKRENKILAAVLEKTPQNVTLNLDDTHILLTVDTHFIDDTKPPITEFAHAPNLNIHLPKDFFFPFPSNNCCKSTNNLFILSLLIVVLALNK